MWFDVQTALKEIEGGLAATPATSATKEAKNSNSLEFVASVADVARLSRAQNTSPKTPDIDAFEERSAVAEFDGGLTRADAEDLAAKTQNCANVIAFRAAARGRCPCHDKQSSNSNNGGSNEQSIRN